MDHRAVKQSERTNASKSPVLEYCGGTVSPDMHTPKLLWVKENLRESWSMTFRWMDLSDWLSYIEQQGDDTRSLCTTVCKWTYLGHAHMQQINEEDSGDMEALGWDDQFWEEIGLGDLVDSHHSKIGLSVAFPGHALGSGLTPDAAKAKKKLMKSSLDNCACSSLVGLRKEAKALVGHYSMTSWWAMLLLRAWLTELF